MSTILEERPRAKQAGATNPIPTLLAALALAISVVSAGWVFNHAKGDPGLSRYNLTTPEASLVSRLKMTRDVDVKSLIALGTLQERQTIDEKLRTLAVKKKVDFKGTTVLFYSYQEKGAPKYDVVAFEKDPATGCWLENVGLTTFGMVAGTLADKQTPEQAFYDSVNKWREKGALDNAEHANASP